MRDVTPFQAAALIPASEPKCNVCKSPKRMEIEAAMLQPGRPLRAIAREFGLILSNIQNHRPHMGAALAAAQALREVESMGELYKRQQRRSADLWAWAAKAAESGNLSAVAQLTEVARKYEEMLAKFSQTPGFKQEVSTPVHVNAPDARIVVTPGPVPEK